VTESRDDGQAAERVVIRDRRKIDPTGGKVKTESGEAETATDGVAEAKEHEPSHAAPETNEAETTDVTDAADTVDTVQTGEIVDAEEVRATDAGAGALGAELEALRSELEERTRDLQRVTAEYANYRKRVDRDRGVAAEQTTGQVLGALLPVLDDLDRAREHGDLVGPFAAVAEQLVAALGKFGLTAYGEKGDPFDPTRHEAVAHLTSAEVTEPTCVDVMRRGYLLGDRLLRAALDAVADPE
jgi:molecular chaperone GrpE